MCSFTLFDGEDAIDRSVKELSQPDDGISLSEKRIISQRALAAKKRSNLRKTGQSQFSLLSHSSVGGLHRPKAFRVGPVFWVYSIYWGI